MKTIIQNPKITTCKNRGVQEMKIKKLSFFGYLYIVSYLAEPVASFEHPQLYAVAHCILILKIT